MRFLDIAMISCALIASSSVTLAAEQLSDLTTIRSSVISLSKSPIGSAKVEFNGRGGKHVTETELDGTYKIRLPKGKFLLTVSAKGYCSRSERVLIDATIHLPRFFPLMECSDCHPMMVDFAQPRIDPDGQTQATPRLPELPSMKYQTEELPSLDSARSKSSVIFGKRTETEEALTYEGLFCPGYDKPVVISYPEFNISARKFVYSREKREIRGEGEVVLLDKNGITKGTTIEISLVNDSPKITLLK